MEEVKRQRGAYYTPPHLATLLVHMVTHAASQAGDAAFGDHVQWADLAAGNGSFPNALLGLKGYSSKRLLLQDISKVSADLLHVLFPQAAVEVRWANTVGPEPNGPAHLGRAA